MCDTMSSSAANQGDNTVSVVQGSTATPSATKQLLPPDRIFKRNIYHIYLIYMYEEDLALNNLQWLICHKTQPNQILYI